MFGEMRYEQSVSCNMAVQCGNTFPDVRSGCNRRHHKELFVVIDTASDIFVNGVRKGLFAEKEMPLYIRGNPVSVTEEIDRAGWILGGFVRRELRAQGILPGDPGDWIKL